MRRSDTALLYAPWEVIDPDPDALALSALREEHLGQWVIWRAITPQGEAGAWCARRAGRQPCAGIAASTPEALRQMLEADQ